MLDRIRGIARGVAQAAPVVLRDVTGLTAVGLVAYGSWLSYAPAGFIVLGVMLLLGAILLARGAR